jgi:hypothetical protein
VGAQKSQGRSVQEIQASISAVSLHSLDEDYQSFLVSQSDDRTTEPPAQIIAAGIKSNIADVFSRLDQS